MLEVDLVVLDAADGEREIDLERPQLGVHLVAGGEIDVGQLAEDLVALVYVPLVQLVVRFNGLSRDAVELEQRRLELARCDFLGVEDERGHRPPLLETETRRA